MAEHHPEFRARVALRFEQGRKSGGAFWGELSPDLQDAICDVAAAFEDDANRRATDRLKKILGLAEEALAALGGDHG